MSALLRLVREWIARRRAPAESFVGALERALREGDAVTLRLSTVERSVGTVFDRPQLRASQED